MADEKRYFWLKLYEDFFGSLRIKRLRKLAGGDTYLIIYLKLQLKAMKSDGKLEWKHYGTDIIDELADDLDESPDDIRVTLMYLSSCGLAETSDNECFFFPYAVSNVGSEGSSAQRMRDARAKAKINSIPEKRTLCEQSATLCEHRYGEKEIEKEKELDTKKRASAERFDRFWKAYPKKVGKGAAEKAFAKYKPDDALVEQMIRAVEAAKRTEQWRKDGGQYIPNPATWLNQKRWEDEPPEIPQTPYDDRGLKDWGVWEE